MTTDFSAALYVDAIAIEREAARRYADLGERMAGCGNHAVAELFRMLARLEAEHLAQLQRRTLATALPLLDADHSWPDKEPPSQRAALRLALEAERSAQAFFEQAARVADDPEARALASEMALEEARHAELIERALHFGRIDLPRDPC